MAFAGVRGVGDYGTSERPTNFREAILWLNPNGSAPLTALLAKAADESVNDPQFSWWEEKLQLLRLRIPADYGTTYATVSQTLTITVDGLRCVPGMVFQVEKAEAVTPDNELIMVSSVTSDTVIVVKRGIANTTPAQIAAGTYLTCLGTAYAEGAAKPSYTGRNPTKYFNYCQIFEQGMGLTWTGEKTFARTGDPWKNEKRRKMFDHASQMELAFIFGVKYEDTGGARPIWYTGGLRSFLTSNVTIFATTPTETTFLDAVYKVFDFSSQAGDERIVLAGNGFMNSLNKLAKAGGTVQFTDVVKLYGMNLQRWVLPQGTLAFKTHPLFNQHPRYTNSALILDPTSLRYRHLIDTKFIDDVETPGTAAHEALWYTQAGLEVQHECTSGYIGNFVV